MLEAFRFAFDDAHLRRLYEANHGRSYTGVLEFPRFVAMVRDCQLQHGGSGHRACAEAERAGTLPVDQSSFYRKLANAPVGLSRALLRECTARLTELMPPPPHASRAGTSCGTGCGRCSRAVGAPLAYAKAVDKRPRPPRPPPHRLPGGHTGVQRLLDGRARVKQ